MFRDGFGFDEIEALTQLAEARLLDALDEALATELLRSVGGERYDFSQPLVRHVLYDRLAPSRRARVHRRLAELLEPAGTRPRSRASITLRPHCPARTRVCRTRSRRRSARTRRAPCSC